MEADARAGARARAASADQAERQLREAFVALREAQTAQAAAALRPSELGMLVHARSALLERHREFTAALRRAGAAGADIERALNGAHGRHDRGARAFISPQAAVVSAAFHALAASFERTRASLAKLSPHARWRIKRLMDGRN